MKILIVSMSFPFPLKSGGKIRVYNLIKEISKYHEIYLISLIYKDEIKYVPELLKFCKQVEVVPFEHTYLSKIIRWLKIFSCLFIKTPAEVAAKESRLMRKKINELIVNNDFDIIQVEWLQMAHYLPFDLIKKTPHILVEHDVSYIPWQRRSQLEKGILKYICQRECNKIMNYEKEITQKFDKIFVVSEIDKNRLLMLYKNYNISVMPNGVDTNNIQAKTKIENTNSLLFIGWMRHHPNNDAMDFFLKQIFPLISKVISDVKLYVVGQHAPKNLVNLANLNPNILFTGYVRDVKEYLYSCTAFICPLRIAGGTRLKILEAMAAGIPVVSTSIGAEGLNITPNENILIADTPEEFAEATIELLRNQELREKIAQNARIFVEENHQWEKIAGDVIEVYEEIIGRRQ